MNYQLFIQIRENYKTQCRFAQYIGKSEAYVSLVIKGTYKFLSETEKQKWAEALDSTVEELFGQPINA